MASKNEEDAHLLYNDPRQLLEKYQSTIGIIVQKFVSSGFFHPAEKADIIQTINEKLWREKIRNMKILFSLCRGDYEAIPDKEIYAVATPIFNRCKGKDNSPDALRKWINMKVDEMIDLLNGRTHRSNYDRELLHVGKFYMGRKK